jgi:hypothetical protein
MRVGRRISRGRLVPDPGRKRRARILDQRRRRQRRIDQAVLMERLAREERQRARAGTYRPPLSRQIRR